MGYGLHVLDVIGDHQHIAETNFGKYTPCGLLFSHEFRFQLFQTDVAGNLNQFLHQRPGQPAPTVVGMNHDADPPDVTLPTCQVLVQRGVSHNSAISNGDDWQNFPVVDMLAPIVDDLGIGDTVLEQKSFGLGNGGKEIMKQLFVGRFQRALRDLQVALHGHGLRITLENIVHVDVPASSAD